MKAVLLLCAAALVSSASLNQCKDCTRVFEKLYGMYDSTDSDKMEESLRTVCDSFDNTTLTEYCVGLLGADDAPDFERMIYARDTIPDICISAKQCEMPALPPPAQPVHVIDSGLRFHSAGKDEIAAQANLQVQQIEDLAKNMSPTINVAAPPPTNGGSGLAWDKHDFEVTNNKGGDVQVEINMAAPMGGGGDSGSDEGDSLAPLIEALVNGTLAGDSGQDEMSEVVRQMNEANRAQTEQMQAWMKSMSDAFKEMAYRSSTPPPIAPQNSLDIPAIIEALHPPPPPVQPPLNIADMMREMRSAISAGQPMPAPPPGADPAMMELLRSAMNDLKEMHKEMAKALASPPPAQQTPVPTPVPGGAGEVPSPGYPQPGPGGPQQPGGDIYQPPPPPMPEFPGGATGTGGLSSAELADQIRNMVRSLMAPLPPPPPPTQSFDLEELRKQIQQEAASKPTIPIILPPPALPETSHIQTVMPPPPPAQPVISNDRIQDLIRDSIPKPQRIPAPPVLKDTVQAVPPCCMAPAPTDPRTDAQRCPKIKGVPLPRCKRNPPPQAAVARCTKSSCGAPVIDSDGDVDLDATASDSIGGASISFNPKALLATLCADGKCDDLNPRPASHPVLASAQSGSL